MLRRVAVVTLFFSLLCVASYAATNRWAPSLTQAGSAVAIDPSDPAVAYAATPSGIFKTSDRGRNWTLIESLERATAIAVNPRNPANVVAGRRQINSGAAASGQLRVSDDGGATWKEVRVVDMDDTVAALVFDPSKPATVYAALIGSGVAKSVDGGKSWTVANRGLLCCAWDFFDTLDVVIAQRSSSTLYAASGRALYETSDEAGSWRQSPTSPAGAGTGFFDNTPVYFEPWNIAVSSLSPEHLFVSGYYQPHAGFLTIKSRDGGVTWETVPLTVKVNRIVFDPNVSTIVYAATSNGGALEQAGRGVLRSIDGGSTWWEFNDGLPVLDVGSISVDKSGSLLYASTPDGIFVCDGCGSGERRRSARK